MTKFIKSAVPLCALLIFSYACQNEEYLFPTKGNVSFSILQKTRDDGRVRETTLPAFVLLSIKDSKGEKQENIKLSLLAFGQGYLSENLELQTGNYQLAQFIVLDAANKVIYATPLEGSELAKYVTDPLPMEFTVTNEGTQITPQVLPVLEDDKPEIFGFVSFEFEVIDYKKVKKVILDGITVQDSLTLHYESGKIASIDWCSFMPGDSEGCLVGYSELRHYNNSGKLDSVSGRWNLSCVYENGLRKKLIAFKDSQHYSTTTFMEYSGTYPTKIKVEFAKAGVQYVDLVFNSSGDVTRKTVKNEQGVLQEDTQVEYTSIQNPLQGVVETPSYAVLFFGFDDFVFYFSKHVPETVVTHYTSDIPVFPKDITISYIPKLNDSGLLVSANAFRTIDGKQYNTHNIHVAYSK